MMTKEQYNKYSENMSKIREIEETKKLTKVQGFKVKNLYDLFGYCNDNNDIVFDIEFRTESDDYHHLRSVSISRLTFEDK